MAYKERELGAMTQFMRGLLVLLNLVFVLASIAGIVVSAMILAGDDHSYFRFCDVCHKFSVVTIISFSSLFLVSFLGCCGLLKRQNCALVIYAVFMVLFFLIAAAISTVIVLVHEGKFDSELSDAWNDSVRTDPKGICELESQVGCSGWESMCGVSNATATCPDCSYNADQAKNILAASQTCKVMLENDVKKYFVILISVGYGLALLALVSTFTACAVRRSHIEHSELYERF